MNELMEVAVATDLAIRRLKFQYGFTGTECSDMLPFSDYGLETASGKYSNSPLTLNY